MTKLGKSMTLLIIIILIGIGFFVFKFSKESVEEPVVSAITNFEECAKAGYSILESYPEQCRTPDGRNFVRVIEEPTPTIDDIGIPSAEFDSTISFKLNDSRAFPDGLVVSLKEINDSRCKPDVECIWAGELVGTFVLNGSTSTSPIEIRLGTASNKSVTKNEYKFTLVSATESELKVIVEKI